MKKRGMFVITAVFILLFGHQLFNSAQALAAPTKITATKAKPSTDSKIQITPFANKKDDDGNTITSLPMVAVAIKGACENARAFVDTMEDCCEDQGSGCIAQHDTRTNSVSGTVYCQMTCSCFTEVDGKATTDTAAEYSAKKECGYD